MPTSNKMSKAFNKVFKSFKRVFKKSPSKKSGAMDSLDSPANTPHTTGVRNMQSIARNNTGKAEMQQEAHREAQLDAKDQLVPKALLPLVEEPAGAPQEAQLTTGPESHAGTEAYETSVNHDQDIANDGVCMSSGPTGDALPSCTPNEDGAHGEASHDRDVALPVTLPHTGVAVHAGHGTVAYAGLDVSRDVIIRTSYDGCSDAMSPAGHVTVTPTSDAAGNDTIAPADRIAVEPTGDVAGSDTAAPAGRDAVTDTGNDTVLPVSDVVFPTGCITATHTGNDVGDDAVPPAGGVTVSPTSDVTGSDAVVPTGRITVTYSGDAGSVAPTGQVTVTHMGDVAGSDAAAPTGRNTVSLTSHDIGSDEVAPTDDVTVNHTGDITGSDAVPPAGGVTVAEFGNNSPAAGVTVAPTLDGVTFAPTPPAEGVTVAPTLPADGVSVAPTLPADGVTAGPTGYDASSDSVLHNGNTDGSDAVPASNRVTAARSDNNASHEAGASDAPQEKAQYTTGNIVLTTIASAYHVTGAAVGITKGVYDCVMRPLFSRSFRR